MIAALETSLAQINRAITALFQEHAPLQAHRQRLESVPGIGRKIAPYLLVLLYRWDALTAATGAAKGLTAYVGLDPLTYTSGRRSYKRAAISKMGNPTIRRLLYMGALGGVGGANPLRDFYQRLVGRGKAKKLALVAAARKMLVWSLMIFRQEQLFDPQRATPPDVNHALET